MSKKHLKFIDSLPCVICGGACGQSTHHHLLRVDKEYLPVTLETSGLMFPKFKSKGMGTKSDDRFTLPLCAKHHAEAHAHGNDKEYFLKHDIQPEKFALALFDRSGDYERAMDLMRWHFVGKGKCSELRNLKKQRVNNFLKGSPIKGIN